MRTTVTPRIEWQWPEEVSSVSRYVENTKRSVISYVPSLINQARLTARVNCDEDELVLKVVVRPVSDIVLEHLAIVDVPIAVWHGRDSEVGVSRELDIDQGQEERLEDVLECEGIGRGFRHDSFLQLP